jgi:hypothetical protein
MTRTLVLGAAWTASAAAAVGLGFLAVSLVDASASPATQPQASTGSTFPASTTPTATPVAATGQMATVGGTVFADCTSGTPVIAGAPAAGWWADDSPKPGEAEFENGTLKVEVQVTCVGGGPVFRMEGPRADDSHGGGHSPAPSSTDAPDDSDGRGGNSGHGSDDSGGDDSSGRGGGGHGSDD